ncbi:hypothetical protein [Vibrio mediterranei]|uniref:hypothetical protein n=1 Tax=Vibrio mediterranei TaxID=689 RepID=UPI004068E1E3
MSILTRSEQCIGVMTNDGFYRPERHVNDYQQSWCCDAFEVSQKIIEVEDNQKLAIDVTFNTPTGEVLFAWDLHSISQFKSPIILTEMLLRNGVRVSPAPEAAYAILDAVQRPNLINTWGKS